MDDWTKEDLGAAVLQYQRMLRMDVAGQKYNKAGVYRNLATELGRTAKSVELRMRNISAVLNEAGLPWVKGLLPARHVGNNVARRILDVLSTSTNLEQPLRVVLAQLRPTNKTSVYEVLRQAGFDMSSWEVAGNGRAIPNPAVTGKAYAWSFHDTNTNQHAFMLWFDEMRVVDGAIRYRRSWREVIKELEEHRPQTARRAEDFLRHFSNLKDGSLVRVGVVEGSQASANDDESSKVTSRRLDSEYWYRSFWDPISGTFEFTRGFPAEAPRELQDPSASVTDSVPADVGDNASSKLENDLREIQRSQATSTEKERMISARLGQGRFRREVLGRWDNKCAVTGISTLAALRGSHCKPWRSCSNAERLDPANGLPLVATLDALFDAGLISFQEDGQMLISHELSDTALALDGLKLKRPPRRDELPFLDYHRRVHFKR